MPQSTVLQRREEEIGPTTLLEFLVRRLVFSLLMILVGGVTFVLIALTLNKYVSNFIVSAFVYSEDWVINAIVGFSALTALLLIVSIYLFLQRKGFFSLTSF